MTPMQLARSLEDSCVLALLQSALGALHGDFRMPQGKGFAEMTVIIVLIVVISAIIMMMVRAQSPRD